MQVLAALTGWRLGQWEHALDRLAGRQPKRSGAAALPICRQATGNRVTIMYASIRFNAFTALLTFAWTREYTISLS